MKEEYDVSFSIDKKEYEGKVIIPNVNKNLNEHDKIDSVKRQTNDIENLKIRRTL